MKKLMIPESRRFDPVILNNSWRYYVGLLHAERAVDQHAYNI